MKRMYIGTGTCVLIIIAFVLIAGCAFLNPGNTPAQPATSGVTPIPTASLEAAQTISGVAPIPTASLEAAQTTSGVTPTSTSTQEATQTTSGVTPIPTSTQEAAQTTQGGVGVAVTPVITAQQTPVAAVADTCANIGGHPCLADETCSGSLISTTDSSRCCAGTCIIPSYANTPAQNAIIPTQVPGGAVVISKTCEVFGGTICQAPQTCNGALVNTTDSSQCCAGTCQ